MKNTILIVAIIACLIFIEFLDSIPIIEITDTQTFSGK